MIASLGVLAYASKRPNPLPAVLGYHEGFHALTLVGATLHFAAVMRLGEVARLSRRTADEAIVNGC